MFVILLVLHIVAFAASLALTAGTGILAGRLARGRDPRMIHTAFVATAPLAMAGGIGWFVTAALGIAIAAEMGIPFTELWMILSYVFFAILVASGLLGHKPWQDRVIKASAAGTMTPELEKLLASPVSPVASALSALSVVALTWLMTAQPS